ncbi:MAG: NAD(P)H-dependent oxidoreductase subunit E [Verrucomicrobiales bacterium]|nr:NAD(P)H-dependent oxidoreductase subunit E [Verrucomicrobiales bacterium]MED5584923.1 NADH-ubiquinone oxidoreductase-F iron-sulfur binding region domain-containing protein [Verrucomicrobiota bacterium]
MTDQDIFDRWQGEDAPLLPVLQAFHDRDEHISEDAIKSISAALKIPLAELFATVTFYHHFSRELPGKSAPRVCTGNVCSINGGKELLDSLKQEGATAMPCAGRCDDMVPVIRGDKVYVGKDASSLANRASPLPAPNPGQAEECVFRHIREEGRATIKGYRESGGYAALEKAVKASSDELITAIIDSKLAGRGGAGFPTGLKWKAVNEAPGLPKSIICNADEGEPGCFKDRAIMDHDPHALIEGMILAAYATSAARGFIYLRYEYPETESILQGAIDESLEAGLLGHNILGREGFHFDLQIRRGAGAYICGEEGSLLNSLEGKHPFPRNKPPFPVTHGFENLPTVVNNVETLASVPNIVRKGSAWYRSLGLNDHAGTKVISLSGDVKTPGNYEVPFGLPLQDLLHEWAGGPKNGRTIQAVTMAGLSGGFLAGDDLAVTLDEASIRSKGSFLGAGGIIVFDDSRDMVSVAHEAMQFFAHESCGKCFPCRIGTQRLSERLNGNNRQLSLENWQEEIDDIGAVMKATSACGLGMAAPHITESLQRYFPEQIEAHLNNTV